MPDLNDLKSQVLAALDSAGYDVAEGVADLFTIEGAGRLADAFGTSFGNNPAAPYIVPAVPHPTGEDYFYGDSMRSVQQNAKGEDLHWTYRLEEHEAILVFGNLPPEAAFIGYETFLFTRAFDGTQMASPEMDWLSHAVGVQRHLSPSPDNLLYDSPPIADGYGNYTNDPNRVTLFANGPTINRRTLEDNLGEAFWGQQAIFSTSPDAGFKAELNANLSDSLTAIHLHSPLGPELKLGTKGRVDDFWTLMRYAVPKNTAEAEAWRSDVANQLVVLRVSKRQPADPVVRHPSYVFEVRKTNNDERVLAADLQTLADAVSDRLGFGEGAPQEVCLPLSSFLHAPLSMPTAMSAVGATHDADYRVSSARGFDSQEVLAVVGVNHARTGNSTYVSLGIYDASIWQGIKAVSQALDYPNPGPLNDSAKGFFDLLGGVPANLAGIDLAKFYVHIVARPNVGLDQDLVDSLYCTEVVEAGSSDDVVLPTTKPIRISERAYLNPDPAASCGPDYRQLLSMIVVAKGTAADQKASRGRRSRR